MSDWRDNQLHHPNTSAIPPANWPTDLTRKAHDLKVPKYTKKIPVPPASGDRAYDKIGTLPERFALGGSSPDVYSSVVSFACVSWVYKTKSTRDEDRTRDLARVRRA